MIASSIEKIAAVNEKSLRRDLPAFDVGDTIKMKIKVKEADKVRIHPFEGTVIKKTGVGVAAAFTVRKISFGEGVERTFPINSPVIDKIEIVAKGVVKRSKLYYLRDRLGKKSRVQVDQSAS
ncbi:MAG: 50S ribosomal protein L19 [Candidatus Omnitrophica bacterium]|nr:50S ribosomal protein L19 [Candidatus Omnitrophota bacterium]